MILDAYWINYETGEPKGALVRYGNPAPYFRKAFSLSGKPKRAVLRLGAMGVVKAYLNGEAVADDYMTPGFADYRKRLPIYEFDVTGRLGEKNAIGLVAGDGWAVGNMGNDMYRCNYCDRIFVMAELDVEYADGSREKIVTDDSWLATTGEILRTDNYMGEYIDRRLSLGDFSAPDYDDSAWKTVAAIAADDRFQSDRSKRNYEQYVDRDCARQRFNFNRKAELAREPIVTVKHRLNPINSYKDKNGNTVYDFGQNMVGVVSASITAASGTRLTFRYGEMLRADGTVYTENLRRAEATDVYVSAGGYREKFRPLFTFHGFRYMEVAADGEAEIEFVTGEVMYTDLKETGEFTCSDEVVNKLYQNIVWGQRGNFVSVPTDCPQRDERLGWTGDAQIFVGSAMFNMDCKAFYEKYMCDLRDSQYGNGAVGGIAPHVPHFDYTEEGDRLAAGWADAITVIPYEHYVMYGDKRTLYDNIGAMKAFVRFCRETSEGFIRPEGDNYGDWLNVGSETDKAVLNTLYFAYSASLTARACRIIGDGEEGEFAALYEDIRRAFRAKFVDGDGTIKSDTQTAYLLAYAFGAMTKEEISGHLVRKLHEADDHLVTGFLGVKFLLPVLCEIGESELCYKVLTRRSYPGWGYSVVNGATTVWERWNSYTVEHGFGDVRMNSFNHYSLGSCCEWMFRYCLGISPVESDPGFKSVLVRPFVDFSGKITSASGSYECAYGKITVRWESDGDTARYSIEIPDGVTPVYDFSAYKSAENRDGVWILGRK